MEDSVWDLSTNVIKLNGETVVLKGFALTCGEYLLRGIGMKCWSKYNWGHSDQLLYEIDPLLLSTIKKQLVGTSVTGATPAIRVTLTAGYYLNKVTN